jgi:hypothetical protein
MKLNIKSNYFIQINLLVSRGWWQVSESLFSENFSANRNQRKDFERKIFWRKAQAAKFESEGEGVGTLSFAVVYFR